MSVEFDSPANRVIAQQQPKNQFRIDTSLPDIAFLRQLSVQGRLRFFQGSTAGTADIITITPATGETFFIYKLYLSTAALQGVYTISNSGNTRVIISLGTNLAAGTETFDLPDSLVGNGIDSIIINCVSTTGTSRGSLVGWVENTSRIRDVTT